MDVIDGAFRRRAAVRSRCRRDLAATTAATVTAGVISAADDADTANGAE